MFKAILTHCVHCSEEDLDLIKKKDAAVVHCPNSNISWVSSFVCYKQEEYFRLAAHYMNFVIGIYIAAGVLNVFLNVAGKYMALAMLENWNKWESELA